MKVVASVAEMRAVPGASGRRVLVPTMGALHDGHLSLMAKARELAGDDGQVVVSVFVNPIQFDRANDLAGYPRPVDEDLRMCGEAGVDVVFMPEADSMYHPDRSVTVSESLLSGGLCGATRPGHFDGVCTVVLKLFNICRCDVAVFGAKDFQQLAVIRRMVRDLDVPVEIVACPTVREEDGLAMSSRNRRLTPEQRAHAAGIRRVLLEAAAGRTVDDVLGAAQRGLGALPGANIDYLELVDAETLQVVDRLDRPAVLATAVFFGEVRLIDHVDIGV